jgi:putative Ca2+/H+ antiporter (TMEM165/GDT1 family)
VDLGTVSGFAVVFVVIGGLETIDRTSFALIGLAARHRPVPTWTGSAVAFAATTALAVAIGAALSTALGPGGVGLLRIAGGIFLIGYAAWTYFRGGLEEPVTPPPELPSAVAAAFVTIFLLELGDTTMIFEVVFVANFGWVVVLTAGILALWTVAAWDVMVGKWLGARLSPETLRKLVALLLTAVGAATIAYGLFPAFFPALLATVGF